MATTEKVLASTEQVRDALQKARQRLEFWATERHFSGRYVERRAYLGHGWVVCVHDSPESVLAAISGSLKYADAADVIGAPSISVDTRRIDVLKITWQTTTGASGEAHLTETMELYPSSR